MTLAGRADAASTPMYEEVPELASSGVRAFTTTRAAGSFGVATEEPVRLVMERWNTLRRELAPGGPRLATSHQVHGNRVLLHGAAWEGWLRANEGDGHATLDRGTALAVSIADCVPVFLAHPSGALALLHSGWRGTAARIVERALDLLGSRGIPSGELSMHLGPAICGGCYEVSPDVFQRLTGRRVDSPSTVDLRAIIADQARLRGVRRITTSASCTRCNHDRFFSHRAGDAGRQVGVMIAPL
ncbi:MAG TPA: polyphenol oxidase family protein [Gemmatimonadaceae bacterium]|jgi:YfiH family protein|nr:polyphenol oxidase family protein [Gemmatimonadaceae bacterium]